jgi:hypothetical protein
MKVIASILLSAAVAFAACPDFVAQPTAPAIGTTVSYNGEQYQVIRAMDNGWIYPTDSYFWLKVVSNCDGASSSSSDAGSSSSSSSLNHYFASGYVFIPQMVPNYWQYQSRYIVAPFTGTMVLRYQNTIRGIGTVVGTDGWIRMQPLCKILINGVEKTFRGRDMISTPLVPKYETIDGQVVVAITAGEPIEIKFGSQYSAFGYGNTQEVSGVDQSIQYQVEFLANAGVLQFSTTQP